MKKMNREVWTRALIAAFILMSGLALIPYLDLPHTILGWDQFAGIYSPELVIEPEVGLPGSTFTATGTNYPANSLATVYAGSVPIGTVMTDENGSAVFYIETEGAQLGVYNITMAVDVNASATDSFRIAATGPFIPAPTDPVGPIFDLPSVVYFPIVMKD
jgi:hypothetical protein